MSETAPKAAAPARKTAPPAVTPTPETPAPKAAATVVAIKPVIPKTLQPHRFVLGAESVIPFSHVNLPAGHTLEDVLVPAYWAHLAHKLQPGGRILVDAEDNSFSAQLKVLRRTDLAAVVTVEWRSESGAAADVRLASKADAFRVHYVNAQAKWRITRNSDGATISEHHETEEIARQVLAGYLQSLAA